MTISAPYLWLDGTIVETASASVPLLGHAAQRGSLLFDVASFQATSRGPALFRARDHVRRFLRSIGIVGLHQTYDEETLLNAAVEVVRKSGLTFGLVRWSAYLDAREPDLLPSSMAAHIAVAAQAIENPDRGAPIRVAVFDDARKASPLALSAETKASAAYLGPMLAKKRAVASGADDVVLLDDDGDIAEAPIANAFAVVNGAVWTPPLGRVLPGITRATVLTLAREENLAVREERLPRDAFASADEAFLTGTSLPIAPISSVNGRRLRFEAPGPITARLLERLRAARRGEDAQHQEWLTFVA